MFSGTVVSISDVLFKISLSLQILSQLGSAEWHDNFGPWVKATQGEPWPSPNTRTLEHGFYIINASDFRFHVVGETCDIVQDAIGRYQAILKTEAQAAEKVASDRPQFTLPNDSVFHGILQELKIQLKNPCTENHDYWPHLYMNETYTLDIQPNNPAVLAADSVWGILRGIETFSQLVSPNGENANLKVRCQRIVDAPKLVHRGLLLDTSRHFFPLKDILLTLDAMSYNKFNVFHWHIVDDNSFPYESLKFPELSKKGAYHSSMVYKPDDVRTVINYARLRGIRVIPEFDTPGHTRSWGVAHPDFLTKCYDAIGNPTGRLGPMNPINPALYKFLEELFSELKKTFPDQYVHLGGDEVPFSCWESNPDIRAYMKAHNLSDNYAALESEYISKLLNITAGIQSNPIVWQEVFDNGVVLRNTTVVHVWKGQWQQEVARVLKAGHPTLLSTCWYLDQSGGSWSWNGDWERLYKCDPLDFYGSDDPSIKHLLLGGEACMWGEFVDRTNVHSRIWPRASAAIERLWSNFANITEAAHRLEEHACRMNRRGVPAQPPNGAGFCIV